MIKLLYTSLLFSFCFVNGLRSKPTSEGCFTDAERLCSEKKERGKLSQMQCLLEKESDLSETCKNWLTKKKEEIRKHSEACSEDRSKYCAFVIPGGGRILKCLMDHESSLSNSCREMIQKNLP